MTALTFEQQRKEAIAQHEEIKRFREQVAELQRANNREVDRRRVAERRAKGEMCEDPPPESERTLDDNSLLMPKFPTKVDCCVHDVLKEYTICVAKQGRFNSPHEGFAVLAEEVDELWDEVRRRDHVKAKIRLEAKQVAAMALRVMVECG